MAAGFPMNSQPECTAYDLRKDTSAFRLACRRRHVLPTAYLLMACVQKQTMDLLRLDDNASASSSRCPNYSFLKRYRISTSRFGTGQINGSNQTPLGLHRIAEKIGAGQPVGAVFKSRQLVGFIWQGVLEAPIAHRILWLDGLEPGFNRGGNIDTHSRYVYIHGLADEPTLGRPASKGCIHMAANDLIPLFDLIPSGTLVWIY